MESVIIIIIIIIIIITVVVVVVVVESRDSSVRVATVYGLAYGFDSRQGQEVFSIAKGPD
jgi:hypothetical protein